MAQVFVVMGVLIADNWQTPLAVYSTRELAETAVSDHMLTRPSVQTLIDGIRAQWQYPQWPKGSAVDLKNYVASAEYKALVVNNASLTTQLDTVENDNPWFGYDEFTIEEFTLVSA